MSDVEIELPLMDQLERVEPPFRNTKPKYRIEVTVEQRIHVEFETWDDPNHWLESDAHIDPLLSRAIPFWTGAEEVDFDGPIEQLQEDGRWRIGIDYDRIRDHEERNA